MDKDSKKGAAVDLLTSSKTAKKNKSRNDSIQKKPFPVFITTCIILVVGVTLSILLAVGSHNGWFRKNSPVVKVGDTAVGSVEFQYSFQTVYNQYYQYLSYMGVDTSSTSFLDEACSFSSEDQTWREYFVDSAMTTLKDTLYLYNEALAAGMKLEDADQAEIDSALESYQSYADQNSVSLNTVFSSVFGKNFNKGDFVRMMEISLLAQKMQTQKTDSLTYTDEQLQQYYEENKSSYDLYTYLCVPFTYETPEDDTSTPDVDESQDTSAKDAAKAQADAFLAEIEGKSREEFLKAAVSLNEENTEESITVKDAKASAAKSTQIGTWLGEAGRKTGETGVAEGTSAYYVLYFDNSYRDDYKLVNVRVLPVNAEEVEDETDTEAVAQAEADAKAKADEIFAKWQENGSTEDAFKTLVTENASSVSDQGLLSDVSKSAYAATYGSEFDTYIFDSARKEGDCQIIETTNGYALVYFVSYGEEYWKSDSRVNLKNKDFSSYMTELENKYADGLFVDEQLALDSTKG